MTCSDYTASSASTGDSGLSTTSYPLALGCKISAGHPLVGQTLNSVTCAPQVSSAVTGDPTIYCYHWNGFGDIENLTNYRSISDGYSSSDFINAWNAKKFTMQTPATVQAGDVISFVLPSGQSGISFFQETNSYTTNTNAEQYRDGWSSESFGWSFTAEYNCSGPSPSGDTVLLPPEPAMVRL